MKMSVFSSVKSINHTNLISSICMQGIYNVWSCPAACIRGNNFIRVFLILRAINVTILYWVKAMTFPLYPYACMKLQQVILANIENHV